MAWRPTRATKAEIDSFDDEDLTEYSGDTGNFSFNTTNTQTGDGAALEKDAGDNEIESGSGLPNYPQPGDEWEFYVWNDNADSGGTADHRLNWAWDPTAGDGYVVQFRWDNNDFALRKETGGSISFIGDGAVSIPWTLQSSTWYRIKVQWDDGSTFGGSDGEHTVTVYDADSEQTASGTFTDTDYTHEGIAWRGLTFNGEILLFDEAYILNP